MNISETVFWLCLCFILGISLASFSSLNQSLLKAFLFSGLFLVFLFLLLKEKKILVIGLCLLSLFSGAWKYQWVESQIEKPAVEKFFGRKINLEACLVEDPERGIDKTRSIARISNSDVKVLITSGFYPALKYGDKLSLKGTLKKPPIFEGFNYQDYLKKQKIYFLMSYPQIEVLENGCANPIKYFSLSLKNRLKQSLGRIVPFSQAGLFEALLWGEEENISQAWKEKLNITGTRHIAAVSGMNITILSVIVLNFLLLLGFWRQQAFWLCLALTFFYVLMIGAPASGIRAGIMAGFFLGSQYFGRLVKPERILVFALTIMLFSNPLLLKSDIGFQLSFLAVLGLIYLGPLFLKILQKLPDFFQIRLNLASTLAAQVFTLPVLLYNFGQLSLVSPIANLLILPAIPFLTVAGFSFSLIGIFSQSLGQLISFPAQILLQLVMKMIDFFASFSLAAREIQVSSIFLVLFYFFLFIFILYLKKKQELEFLDY